MREVLVVAAETIIHKENRRRKKAWITNKILDMMEERRRVKNHSEARCRDWLNARCNKFEENQKRDSREMTTQIRELSEQK